jgi:hypothetical protein
MSFQEGTCGGMAMCFLPMLCFDVMPLPEMNDDEGYVIRSILCKIK